MATWQTVGVSRVKSGYQRGEQTPPPPRCGFCGEKQHGSGRRPDREKACKAWGKQWTKCLSLRTNHLAVVCKSADRPLKPKAEKEEATNAAFESAANAHLDSFETN